MTVGKVYAALMIFDYYKQNRAKRLQMQQQQSKEQTGPGPQVRYHTNTHMETLIAFPDEAKHEKQNNFNVLPITMSAWNNVAALNCML